MNHGTIQLVLCAAQCDVVKCFILRKTGAFLLSQHNTFLEACHQNYVYSIMEGFFKDNETGLLWLENIG